MYKYGFNQYSEKAQNIADKVANLTEEERINFYAQAAFYAFVKIFEGQFKEGNAPQHGNYFNVPRNLGL